MTNYNSRRHKCAELHREYGGFGGNMKKYRMLALDLDGTTLNSKKEFPAETVAAIAELTKKGVVVAIASGRCPTELTVFDHELNDIEYAITLNGGIVQNIKTKENIFCRCLDKDDALDLIAIASSEEAMVHISTPSRSVAREEDIARMGDFGMAVYQPMFDKICARVTDWERFIEENATRLGKLNIYHRTPESRERSRTKMENHPRMDSIFAETTALEFVPKGMTKFTGLIELCKYLGIDFSEVVAVGDAPNDLEIIENAGMGVAMANAIPEVKAVAQAVVADNDHNGVLEAINRFF